MRDIVVDLDGPILQSQGLRIGLSVGELSELESVFLQKLRASARDNVIIYSSRPLWGAYAQFWNQPGGVAERVLESLSLPQERRETLLLRQLQKLGWSASSVVYPKGWEAIFFPLYKWNEWMRLKSGRPTCLSEKLRPEASLVYLGDTRADKRVFRQLVKRLRGTADSGEEQNMFIQFYSACPGELF